MNNTYTMNAGGVTWTIGRPGTEEMVTVTIKGTAWPMPVAKATSAKGTFYITHYEKWNWRPSHRPLEHDCWLGLDVKHKPLVKDACLETVLWSLATGRDPAELPDCWTTASDATDDQPRHRPQRQPQGQGSVAQQQGQPEEQPRANVSRGGMGQRLARLTRLFNSRGDDK
jgi:hypothetical protein